MLHLQAIANGDSRALHSLYTRHGLAILAYLNNQLNDVQLAEEVLQDDNYVRLSPL
jgi:hypothetical protein